MAEIERKCLSEVTPQDKNILVVCLIIGKTQPNIFISKRTQEFCGVITLTVRDSKKHFTNIKIWLNKEKIDEINQRYHLYDVIDVICPRIIYGSNRSSEDKLQFEPTISLSFSLVITEESGYIEHHLATRSSKFKIIQELRTEPLKAITSSLFLADIHSSGIKCSGQFVDLLVCVRMIKPLRNVTSKSGSNLQCLELIVIDKSFLKGILFTIWNYEWITRVMNYWEPLKTVLHLIDIRVGYSTFYKQTVLGVSSRSLILENPNIKEANELRDFIIKTELPTLDNFHFSSFDLPSADSIKTVMTVQQIYDRMNGHLKDDNTEEFTAVLYAMITKFDIDGYSNIIAKKCKICKKRLKQSEELCINERCQMQFSFNDSNDKFDKYFDINIHLTDHTGTLMETRLSNNIAEDILNINADNFLKLDEKLITKLKWKFLMSRFEAKLLIKKKSLTRYNNYLIIINLKSITLDDTASNILMY